MLDKIQKPFPGKSTIAANDYELLGLNDTFKVGFIGAAKLLGNIKGLSGLDKGCGNGRSTKFLHRLGAKVKGVDIDDGMIQVAKKLLPYLPFSKSTYDQIPFKDNTFDFAFSAFSHVENDPTKDSIIQSDKEVYRVLKPGGFYIILTSNPQMWGHEYKSFKSYFPPDFKGESGNKVNMTFKDKVQVTFQDYYWKEEDYGRILTQAGFDDNFEIIKPVPINDLCNIPPAMIIKAHKSKSLVENLRK